MNIMILAPIVIFVYNRPWHTQQTVEALQKNVHADQSDLIVFSDAAKTSEAASQVQEVREYLKNITGFKSIRIIQREENWGLAKSIIKGVTEVVNQYGKVIVLEDDIVTSPAFLQFMNRALDFYENEKRVWHISGWSFPLTFSDLGDAFFWRGMNCWGWATWADRWRYFEKSPEALVNDFTEDQKFRFEIDGAGVYWDQVEANYKGRIDTWAVFWYASIFLNNGLCLNPSVSYVENIGHDGTGIHCGEDKRYSIKNVNNKKNIDFPSRIAESKIAVSEINKFYKGLKRPFFIRVAIKITHMMFGRNIWR